MPDFNSDYLSAPSAQLYIFSVMVFPREVEKQRAFAQSFLADVIAEDLSSGRLGRVDPTLAGWLRSAPRLPDVVNDRQMEIITSEAQFVGWALAFILRAAEHGHPELASLNEAYRRAQHIRRGKRRASLSTFKKAWSKYAGVSHLWLTDHCTGKDGFGRWAGDPKMLRVFLAGAEDLRRRGERHIPEGATEPTLDPQVTWKVPCGFTLPSVAVPLPPLKASELDLGVSTKK